MPISIEQSVQRIQGARDNPNGMALLVIDFLIETQPERKRPILRKAIEAAAVPHWFDADILAGLISVSRSEAQELLDIFARFPMIESFDARGPSCFNVHETSRLAIRKRLYETDMGRFKELSARAIDAVGPGLEPYLIVERLFHRFAADPDKAANECEVLYRDWAVTANSEISQMLRAALLELERTKQVSGHARAEVMLVIAWIQTTRGEAGGLKEWADTALNVARASNQTSAIAQALCLVGDVNLARGNVNAASSACEESLNIFKRLTSEKPTDSGLARDLAVAYSRYGDALSAQGHSERALDAQLQGLRICKSLVEKNSSNAGWQLHLSAAQNAVGKLLRIRGKIDDALATFQNGADILEKLLRSDRDQDDWRMRLANAHGELGYVLSCQGHLNEALGFYKIALDAMGDVARLDPSNSTIQTELAFAFARYARALQMEGKLDEALVALKSGLKIAEGIGEINPEDFRCLRNISNIKGALSNAVLARGQFDEALKIAQENLMICRKLTEKDPLNFDCQRLFGLAHSKIGDAFFGLANYPEALSFHEKARECFKQLVSLDPMNTDLRRELSLTFGKEGEVLRNLERWVEAKSSCEACLKNFEDLVRFDPGNGSWQHDLAFAFFQRGTFFQKTGDLSAAAGDYLQYVTILRSLTATDASNAQAIRNLGVALGSFAGLEIARNNKKRGHLLAREAAILLERVSKAHPDQIVWKKDFENAKRFERSIGHW
jgi:tetratricopeptide (TPR) repeat protein